MSIVEVRSRQSKNLNKERQESRGNQDRSPLVQYVQSVSYRWEDDSKPRQVHFSSAFLSHTVTACYCCDVIQLQIHRQGKFVYIAHFSNKATQSALHQE